VFVCVIVGVIRLYFLDNCVLRAVLAAIDNGQRVLRSLDISTANLAS